MGGGRVGGGQRSGVEEMERGRKEGEGVIMRVRKAIYVLDSRATAGMGFLSPPSAVAVANHGGSTLLVRNY